MVYLAINASVMRFHSAVEQYMPRSNCPSLNMTCGAYVVVIAMVLGANTTATTKSCSSSGDDIMVGVRRVICVYRSCKFACRFHRMLSAYME
jgi:hypothetical protein